MVETLRNCHTTEGVTVCDWEAALENLLSEAACMRGEAVSIPQHSAVGNSQGNDFIDRAVSDVEMVQTEKLDVEASVSHELIITTV